MILSSAALADFVWLICTVLAVIGIFYTTCALVVVGFSRINTFGESSAQGIVSPPVTILKPLHGSEPQLKINLATFCDQNYGADVQIVFGVQDPADPAIAIVRALIAEMSGRSTIALNLVVDAKCHGANAKISNLINMMASAKHDVIVVADSDMRVRRDYLSQIMAALSAPGVGAVTCLYHGLPAGGIWSRLSAMAIDTQFLPGVLVGLSAGLAKPCFGSTIALRRETLIKAGGFEALKDQLADDYALGAAVRALGLTVAVPPLLIGHLCAEQSLSELFHHELRWARTIRQVDPLGFIGSVVTYPLPFALIGALLAGFETFTITIALFALATRLALQLQLSGRMRQAAPLALLPLRDVLSLVVYGASLSTTSVVWRGAKFKVGSHGTMSNHGMSNHGMSSHGVASHGDTKATER